MKVAAIQMCPGPDVAVNLEAAERLLDQAAEQGAGYALLPEYCTYMGPSEDNPQIAETIPGPTTDRVATIAKRNGMYIQIGSMLETNPETGKPWNTSVLINPSGEITATYRKVHLFDIDIPGELTSIESDSVSAGDRVVIAEAGEMTLGLAICFDLRFPQLFSALSHAGVNVFPLPAAFAYKTGSAHWHTLLRARAIEQHAYVIAAALAGPGDNGWISYGHSMIIDPWGEILTEADEAGEAVLIADLDLEAVSRRRRQVPVMTANRPDAYAHIVHEPGVAAQ